MHPDERTDELPWDLDLTVVRRPPAPVPSAARRARGEREPRRGRFHRPDLETRWQRFSRNLAVRVGAATLLVGGTASLVVAAITR